MQCKISSVAEGTGGGGGGVGGNGPSRNPNTGLCTNVINKYYIQHMPLLLVHRSIFLRTIHQCENTCAMTKTK